MPTIRPITELRNTNDMSELCHSEAEPVFITKNGREDLVIMSVETYERDQALMGIYRKLGEAEQQLLSGVKPIDADEAFGKLRQKYGY